MLRTVKESTQALWSQQKVAICLTLREKSWRFCRRTSVLSTCLSKCKSLAWIPPDNILVLVLERPVFDIANIIKFDIKTFPERSVP